MATEARTRKQTNGGGPDPAATLEGAAGRASAILDRAGEEMPALVDRATAALNDSARRLERSPDDVLTTGAALSTGLAVGLYLGGAPRLLVTLAAAPALAMGWTLLGRSSRAGGATTLG